MPRPDRKPDPDFEPDYDTPDVEYDELPQADHEPAADADYDEAAQPEYDTEFADPDASEGSQEYYKRSQK